LQDLDHPAADAHSGFRRIIPFPPRHHCRLEQEQQVDIGRVIELLAAKLAKRDDGDAAQLFARDAFRQCSRECPFDCGVGEIGEGPSGFLEAELTGQIAKCDGKGEAEPLAAKLGLDVIRASSERCLDRLIAAFPGKDFNDPRKSRCRIPKERRELAGTPDRVFPGNYVGRCNSCGSLFADGGFQRKPPCVSIVM
jgi:hypothetical protein